MLSGSETLDTQMYTKLPIMTAKEANIGVLKHRSIEALGFAARLRYSTNRRLRFDAAVFCFLARGEMVAA
jgi:hypothetical protein